MNHHKVDLTKTSFVCTRGVVRMVGELARQAAHSNKALSASDVECLEQDLARLRGVVRVHMDLKNWLRQSEGTWQERGNGPRFKPVEEPSEETPQSLTETRIVPVDSYFVTKRRNERLKEIEEADPFIPDF